MSSHVYAVRVGRQPGIYGSWVECQAQVKGYPGAVFKKFEDREEAMEYVGDTTQSLSKVEPVAKLPSSSVRIRISPARLPFLERIVRDERNLRRLYVDGGHNKSTGLEAWGRVTDAVGIDLIAPHVELFPDILIRDVVLPKMGASYVLVARFDDVAHQCNGAELTALVAGLRIALHYGNKVKVIGSDSTTALSWSQHLGEKSRARMDPRKAKLIDECIELRRKFEAGGGQVVKIAGDDNLSDLGSASHNIKLPPR